MMLFVNAAVSVMVVFATMVVVSLDAGVAPAPALRQHPHDSSNPAADAAASPAPARLTSCVAVKPIFVMKNISTEIPDQPVTGDRGLSLCPVSTESEGSCCTADMEDRLRSLVRHDLQSVIRHSALSVQGVLETNADEYSELLTKLTQRSENRTQELFEHVYERLAPQARAPIATLYSELRRALTISTPTSSLNDSSTELEEAVNTFFSQLFPLVYRHSVTHASGELSRDYSVCLQATMSEVRPYGETPRALATAVSRAVRATRELLRALRLGVEVLDATERIWVRGDECSSALLRMSYCARCAGLAKVKPCAGYCLNVLRGCLAHLAELDSSWNGFVDDIERLVVARSGTRVQAALLNAEKVIRNLATNVSEAIMHAMENGPALEKRVKTACGPAQWVDTSSQSNSPIVPSPTSASSKWSLVGPESAEDDFDGNVIKKLLNGVVLSLARSRRFYAGLADTLCMDKTYAETAEDADCWNGHRVAQYTKTVVGSGVGAQKYNPEMAWGSRHQPDPEVAKLSDKLRRTRQLLLGQHNSLLESDSLMMMDEGSGSGVGFHPEPDWNERDDEDDRNWEASGSGLPPIDQEKPGGSQTPTDSNKGTGGDNQGRKSVANTPTGAGPTIHPSPWISLGWCTLLLVLLTARAQ